MDSKTKSLIKIVALIAVAAILAFATLSGFKIAGYTVMPIKQAIKLGLDLRGGVSVLLEAKPKHVSK